MKAINSNGDHEKHLNVWNQDNSSKDQMAPRVYCSFKKILHLDHDCLYNLSRACKSSSHVEVGSKTVFVHSCGLKHLIWGHNN